MQTRTYQLYATTSQANAANRRIIAPGYVHMVCWSVYLNGTADNDSFNAELSFQSNSQLTTDDAQGVIDTIVGYQNLVTSGLAFSAINKVCNGMYIPVQTGQLIYLNTNITGAAAFKVLLHVMER